MMTIPGCLLLDHRLQQLGDRERLQFGVGLDQHAAIGAHRQRGADRLLALLHAGRHHDDLADEPLLAQPQGFLDGDLVERVHRHLDVGEFDPGLVRLDAHLDIVIDDPLDGDERFHGVLFPAAILRRISPRAAEDKSRSRCAPIAGVPRNHGRSRVPSSDIEERFGGAP